MADEGITARRYVARLLVQQHRDVRMMLSDAMDAAAERRPRAGVTQLFEWVKTQPDEEWLGTIIWQGIDEGTKLLNVADDYARGMLALLGAESLTSASLFAIARSLGEAIMRFCYVFDTEVPPAKYVLRQLAIQVEAVEGNQRAADAFGTDMTPDEVSRIGAAVAQLHDFLNRNGIVRRPSKNPMLTSSIGRAGVNETIEFNATDAYRKYMPGSSFQWNLGSGAAHSRSWMLPSIVAGIEDEALSSEAEVLASTATGVLALADAISFVAERHSGESFDNVRKRTHLRRLALLRIARPAPNLAVDHLEYHARDKTLGWTKDEPNYGVSFYRTRA